MHSYVCTWAHWSYRNNLLISHISRNSCMEKKYIDTTSALNVRHNQNRYSADVSFHDDRTTTGFDVRKILGNIALIV